MVNTVGCAIFIPFQRYIICIVWTNGLKTTKQIVQDTESKFRDRKFTIAHPEVYNRVIRSSDALFFWAEILRIEIIDMISVCPNRSPLRAIGNDMSLIWLSHVDSSIPNFINVPILNLFQCHLVTPFFRIFEINQKL